MCQSTPIMCLFFVLNMTFSHPLDSWSGTLPLIEIASFWNLPPAVFEDVVLPSLHQIQEGSMWDGFD